MSDKSLIFSDLDSLFFIPLFDDRISERERKGDGSLYGRSLFMGKSALYNDKGSCLEAVGLALDFSDPDPFFEGEGNELPDLSHIRSNKGFVPSNGNYVQF